MPRIDDNLLTEISSVVDKFICDCIVNNNMTINEFNGIMMARMMIMNSEVNNVKVFLQLLDVMKEEQYHNPINSPLQ